MLVLHPLLLDILVSFILFRPGFTIDCSNDKQKVKRFVYFHSIYLMLSAIKEVKISNKLSTCDGCIVYTMFIAQFAMYSSSISKHLSISLLSQSNAYTVHSIWMLNMREFCWFRLNLTFYSELLFRTMMIDIHVLFLLFRRLQFSRHRSTVEQCTCNFRFVRLYRYVQISP